MGLHPVRLHEREELLPVLPCQVGDRPKDSFFPQESVGEGREVAHVDPGADDRASLGGRGERRRDERSHGREDHRRVEGFRSTLVRTSRPVNSEAASESLALHVARAGERIDLLAPVARHLDRDVGSRSEAVEPQTWSVARESKSAEPDEPRAQQRSGLDVRVGPRNREGKSRIHQRELRIAPIEIIAGESRAVAEVLPPRPTERTHSASPTEPRDAEPGPDEVLRDAGAHLDDRPDDLVTENRRMSREGQLAVEDVKVRATDSARGDLDPDLPRIGGSSFGLRVESQRRSGCIQDHRSHAPASRSETELAGSLEGVAPKVGGVPSTSPVNLPGSRSSIIRIRTNAQERVPRRLLRRIGLVRGLLPGSNRVRLGSRSRWRTRAEIYHAEKVGR